MSLVGTSLGRMAYGAGQVANKYIDQEIETQKAQAIADIQRNSAMAMDQYTNSPERRERMRGATAADVVSESAAKDQASLATATNDRLNTALSATAAQRAGAVAGATSANTAHVVGPENEVIVGPGKNTTTPWQMRAYQEGLKGASKEDRDRLTEAHISGINKTISETTAAIVKGLGDGTLSRAAPKEGDKPNPQYEAYQELKGILSSQQQALASVLGAARQGAWPRDARSFRS